ncbi:aminotransferase class I/II-fold pyridoxal phosphate-dependent enzyme [Pedobacter kyonggii]|uniref:cysteine-S-conjugate beta-lyase n=1 Tax=Pedobacter kyonggii TaxID=1926871 RepID=A0A4Q9H6G4_9SPHI|nr:aminotransferase class I/II-fold pyridoxal phosphate-dependent enzyme [Pedobacter kyonggii]
MQHNGTYEIDFDDLDRKASQQLTSLFLLCNPKNLIGRVWKKDELERNALICTKHDVMVVQMRSLQTLRMRGVCTIHF